MAYHVKGYNITLQFASTQAAALSARLLSFRGIVAMLI
jgi:hypothetical protein